MACSCIVRQYGCYPACWPHACWALPCPLVTVKLMPVLRSACNLAVNLLTYSNEHVKGRHGSFAGRRQDLTVLATTSCRRVWAMDDEGGLKLLH